MDSTESEKELESATNTEAMTEDVEETEDEVEELSADENPKIEID